MNQELNDGILGEHIQVRLARAYEDLQWCSALTGKNIQELLLYEISRKKEKLNSIIAEMLVDEEALQPRELP